MPPRLHVNVDHVATIRQQRGTRYPDPVTAAALAELAGAHGITIHLREDRRHIQDRDLRLMRETVQTHLNLEMAATLEMSEIALRVRPDTVTLVPEKREELTTEGGLDVAGQKEQLGKYIQTLREGELRVSLFVDADVDQIKASHKVGADLIEVNTGRYVEASPGRPRDRELLKIADAARLATRLGMAVAAGHGLDYVNTVPIALLPEVEELNIGHAIVSRAVLVGLERAIREMMDLLGCRGG